MGSLRVGFGLSEKDALASALDEAVAAAKASAGGDAQVAFITSTVDHDAQAVHAGFRERLPGVKLHGVTTSLGVLTSSGVQNGGRGAVACLLLGGDDQQFHCGHSTLEDAHAAGKAAASALKEAAGGEVPHAILFHASPGAEEAMLEGVAEVFPDVPCQGGSAADNAIAGEWWVFTDEGPAKAGVSLLGLFGQVNVGVGLVAPYKPEDKTAPITAAHDRQLEKIDGRPAAQVLGEWLGGTIDQQVEKGGNILAQTALHPVAIKKNVPGGAHYTTIHAAQVHAGSGNVDVFARVQSGDELTLMCATEDDLASALPGLIDTALAGGSVERDKVRAALLIFCAGCAGALGPRLDEALKKLSGQLPDGAPVFGLCTFGEQGFVPGLGSVHQDLSLSVMLLGD